VNETNWAGNYRYAAKQIHRPQSLGELQDVVVAADRIRVLGSRHSFTDIVDAAELLSLASMPSAIEVDSKAMTVKVPGQFTYAAVCDALRPAGLALHNLASLPHISVAGAIATGTHGSGDGNGNLATAVRAITLMTADGETVTFDRSHADFAGAVVSLGALGVVLGLSNWPIAPTQPNRSFLAQPRRPRRFTWWRVSRVSTAPRSSALAACGQMHCLTSGLTLRRVSATKFSPNGL